MSGIIASISISAITTGMSIAKASKESQLQKEAKTAADMAFAEANKRLEMNVYEELGIAKLPYQQMREAALVQGAITTEAARESEGRGVAATAGRVQMAQQEMQADIAAKQEKETMELNKLVATEEGRLLDIGTQLDLEEAAGAQMAAQQAKEASDAATMQAVQGLGNIAQLGIQAAPLYSKAGITQQKQALAATSFDEEQKDKFRFAGKEVLGIPSNLADMSNQDFRKYLSRLTPAQKNMLFLNPEYAKNISGIANPFNPIR